MGKNKNYFNKIFNILLAILYPLVVGRLFGLEGNLLKTIGLA